MLDFYDLFFYRAKLSWEFVQQRTRIAMYYVLREDMHKAHLEIEIQSSENSEPLSKVSQTENIALFHICSCLFHNLLCPFCFVNFGLVQESQCCFSMIECCRVLQQILLFHFR